MGLQYNINNMIIELDKDQNELYTYKPCVICKHLISLSGKKCQAFKDVIPDEIWIYGNDHKSKLNNQINNITFELKS